MRRQHYWRQAIFEVFEHIEGGCKCGNSVDMNSYDSSLERRLVIAWIAKRAGVVIVKCCFSAFRQRVMFILATNIHV